MSAVGQNYGSFKRAVGVSITFHILLLLLIILSPYLPKTSKKGMVHYVNMISFPGGGGGSGGTGGAQGGGVKTEQKLADTEVPVRESLRDLTTPQKLQQESPTPLRHPVEKPKREKQKPAQKKDVIRKADATASKRTQTTKTGTSGSGTGTDSGLPVGIGEGTGSGVGFGSEFSSQIGLSTFPYTYYLKVIHTRVSSNWFTSQISPGISGEFHTTLSFKIYRNGEISSPEIKEQSGVRALDLSAVRAIHSSAPFPPLPHDYEGEYLGITLIFWHQK
ncbi:MAG: TonB C-terminal domain-containing protein [Candidatus Aminicenantes bacterium]|nr:TonB C-terminal domain-containing protein [Candidatus Aminicenantes bacterium]